MNFSTTVEKYVNDIESKNKHFQTLKEELSNKESEIHNYHKVSFVKNLDKQVEEHKKHNEVLKLRIDSLQKTIQTLKSQIKNENVTETVNNYEEYDTLFATFLKSRMTKTKLSEHIHKMYESVRGKETLDKMLQLEETRKQELLAKKQEKLAKKKQKLLEKKQQVEKLKEEQQKLEEKQEQQQEEQQLQLVEETEEPLEEAEEVTKEVVDETDEVMSVEELLNQANENNEEDKQTEHQTEQQTEQEKLVEEVSELLGENDDDSEQQVEQQEVEAKQEEAVKAVEESETTDKLKKSTKQKKSYPIQILDSIQTIKGIQYHDVLFKKKQYYLNKSENIIYRRKKSGKVGKQYGTYNKDNTFNKL